MIVEFALLMPMLMLLLLGMVGVFYLDLQTRRMQNGIDVLADLAAKGNGSWHAEVAKEDKRTGCNADPQMPEETRDKDTLTLRWTCHLRTGWIFDGMRITVESKAVLGQPEPSPVPS